jgi:SAM-dependent MidA family methyltransferase
MSDPDFSLPFPAANRAESYPNDSPPATHSLRTILRQKIERTGPLGFPDFMATALYDPQFGYYARETRQVGRAGDFFTSVSVGPLFGELLARRFLCEWEKIGAPTRWRIIEFGAHDGILAKDILRTIARLNPAAFTALEYAIPEPLPLLQSAQRKTLADFSEKMRFVLATSELFPDPLPGIAFGNELLDAIPFHIIERQKNGWLECKVTADSLGEFVWENNHPITDSKLQQAVDLLGNDFRESYRTEVRTNFREFLAPLTQCLTSGLLLWLDYGFARPEYYHPDRKSGTLRTFSKHRAAENPLATPGEIDITAHVDFTAVAEAAILIGCVPTAFMSQGSWLTEQARDWLISLEENPDFSTLRQFQTLTHPAHLGGSFHVIELAWNQPDSVLSEICQHRLALTSS